MYSWLLTVIAYLYWNNKTSIFIENYIIQNISWRIIENNYFIENISSRTWIEIEFIATYNTNLPMHHKRKRNALSKWVCLHMWWGTDLCLALVLTRTDEKFAELFWWSFSIIHSAGRRSLWQSTVDKWYNSERGISIYMLINCSTWNPCKTCSIWFCRWLFNPCYTHIGYF